MKWFIPPMRRSRSHRHAAMHEPRVVTISMSWSETKNSPGSTLTAWFLKLASQKKNDDSPAERAAARSCSSREPCGASGAGADTGDRADNAISNLHVDRLAAQVEQLAGLREVLRVADVEQAVGHQRGMQPLQHAA